MRAALLVVLTSVAWAKPHGYWGEERGQAPSFALAEERRAPKLPDGRQLFAELAGKEENVTLKNGVLVCINSTTERSPGLWGSHNVGLSFAFRNDPPIRLWAAWLHDESYVSIPRVDLAPGDKIAVRFHDRGIFSDSSLGASARRFDGKFPIVFDLKKIYVECRALSRQGAERLAAGRLGNIDRKLDELERAPAPDFATQWIPMADPDGALDKVRDNYGKLSLRYVAGYLGWEDPIVQERVARIAQLEAARKAALLAAVGRGLSTAAPAGTWVDLAPGRRARVERIACGRAALDFIEMHERDDCAALIEMTSSDGTLLDCQDGARVDLRAIGAEGHGVEHVISAPTVFDDADRICRAPSQRLLLAFPLDGKPRPRLLQLRFQWKAIALVAAP